MDKFRFELFWKCYNAFQVAITRERSIILQIHKSQSKKTWLGAYRNSYLHFMHLALSSCSTLHTHTHTHTDTQTHHRIYTSLAHAHRGIIIAESKLVHGDHVPPSSHYLQPPNCILYHMHDGHFLLQEILQPVFVCCALPLTISGSRLIRNTKLTWCGVSLS